MASEYRRPTVARVLCLFPWAVCLAGIFYLGWVALPSYMTLYGRAADRYYWLAYSSPFTIAFLQRAAYAVGFGFSPLAGHTLSTPFWAGSQKKDELSGGIVSLTIINAVILVAVYFIFVNRSLTWGYRGVTVMWILGLALAALDKVSTGHTEVDRKEQADEQRERQRRDEESRRADIGFRKGVQAVEAERLQRTIQFEEMRQELTSLYLRNMNYLARTDWTADSVRGFFRNAESIVQERWDEIVAAFEAHRYDLQMHSEVWKVALYYEKVTEIIGDRLSKEHLWDLLRGIQQTYNRQKPIEKIIDECRSLAEEIRRLVEESKDSWLRRHDDETARSYEALLELPIATQTSPSPASPERSSPGASLASAPSSASLDFAPPVRITSDA